MNLDFRNSSLLWLLKNNASYGRFSIESKATLFNNSYKEIKTFYLLSSVIAGNVYAKSNLVKVPTYEYMGIFSDSDFKICRTYSNNQVDSSDEINNLFDSVKFNLKEVETNSLNNSSDIKNAIIEGHQIISQVTINQQNSKSGSQNILQLDFPVKHINFNPNTNQFQVETGPVPIFEDLEDLDISSLKPSYIFFNRFDEAYFATREAGKPIDESSFHYSQILCKSTINKLAAIIN